MTYFIRNIAHKIIKRKVECLERRNIPQRRWDASCQIIFENIKSYKLQQRAQLNRNIPSKFIPKKKQGSELRTVGEVAWNFPCQRVIVKTEKLQPEQMSDLLWNFAV
jgi:hypothetical protein